MNKIKIEAKHSVKEQPLLKELAEIRDPEISIEVIQEEQPKEPTISKSSLAAHVIQEALGASQALAQSDSVVRIWWEVAIGAIGTKTVGSIKKAILRIIAANNRKKGNMVGAKVSITQEIDGITHVCDFICDEINEGDLDGAYTKITKTITDLKSIVGDEYLKK